MIKKYEEFVSKLQTATDKRTIAWEKASGNDEYQAMIGNNSVSIKYHPAADFPVLNSDTENYVSLILRNSNGDKIDEVRIDAKDFDYHALHVLYESARRACNKVEETLDEILSVLEKKD